MRVIYAKLVGMSVVWGAAFVGIRHVAQHIGPFSGAALRFSIAAVVLSLFVRGLPKLSAKQWGGVLLMAATGVFGYNALLFVGLKNVESARGALIVASNPVFTVLAAAAFFGEKVGVARFFGVLLSLFGCVLVIVGKADGVAIFAAIGAGEGALFGCIACWVIYSLCGKKMLGNLPVLPVVFLSTALGALMLCLAALLTEPLAPVMRLPWSAWLALLLMGVFSTAFGNFWYYEGIAKIGAARSAVFISFVPLSAGLLGALFLGEGAGLYLFVGGGMTLAGVAIVNRRAG